MNFTPREIAASQALASAVLELAAAVDEGRASRRAAEVARTPPPLPARPMSEKPEKILLTSREAAEMLSISPGTLFNMRAPKGPIPVVFLGAAVRYPLDDIRRMLAERRVKPAAPQGAATARRA